jgi:hypothetical protein
MAAFVESAITPEQRDAILSHLVEAVADFGKSGLLERDDGIYGGKMNIETIVKSFGAAAGAK